ncbi:PucR family transcriptional regulator [Dactylosporangium salmoneum]|uniref:PucR family transcriptional regulator n=1 Tax=Dactylosporangium salmoneum TaxID=53361 RepID=A0ABN3GT26_9ACTN
MAGSSTNIGITVEEALTLPALAHARLVAGASGSRRRIRSVNMMEVPDIAAWLREDELLVTTAYPLRNDARALPELIRLLAERGLAGLALKPGRYIAQSAAETHALADELAFPLIELDVGASFNDILGDVLGTILNRQAVQLERSQAIHERLTSVVLAGGGLPDLIEALAQLTQGHAAIVDAHGTVLAASSDTAYGLDPPGTTQTVRAIRAGSANYGSVIVWSHDERIAPDTLVAMDHAATIAALAMAQAEGLASREHRSRVLLLEELVSWHTLDRDDALARGAAFGWDLTRPRAAVLVELRRPDGQELLVAGQPLEEQLVHATTRALGQGTIAWALRSGIVVLLETGTIQPDVHAGQILQAAVRGVHSSLHVAIGIGREYGDLVDFHHSYREAVETLTLGQQLHGAHFVAAYDQMAVYRLLSEVSSDGLERHVQDTLGPVIEFDRRHNGALVETLECYLRNNRNRAATARALFVHYNTLRYRLGQIDRLLGCLNDERDAWLTVELAMRARWLLMAQGRGRPRRFERSSLHES